MVPQKTLFVFSCLILTANCAGLETQSSSEPTTELLDSSIYKSVDNGPKGRLIQSEDFESGGWDESFWSRNWCKFSYSCQVVGDPSGGGKVFRAEYRPENCKDGADYDRSTMGDELKSPNLPYDEQWLGLRVYFDSKQFGPDRYPMLLFQHHGKPDFDLGENWRQPVTAFKYQNGGLTLLYRGSKDKVTPVVDGKKIYTETGSITMGKPNLDAWNSFVVHTVWDPTGNNGLLEIWHDGEYYSRKNINISYNDATKPSLKFGQYGFSCSSDDPARVSFYDDIKFSVGSEAEFCDVVPPGSILPANIQCQ